MLIPISAIISQEQHDKNGEIKPSRKIKVPHAQGTMLPYDLSALKKQRLDIEEDRMHRTWNVSISSVGDALRTWYSFQKAAPPSDVLIFRMKLMGVKNR